MVAIVAAMTVWYIPGWLRTHTPQDGVAETLAEIFPEAKVEFREWDGDRIDWSKSLAKKVWTISSGKTHGHELYSRHSEHNVFKPTRFI